MSESKSRTPETDKNAWFEGSGSASEVVEAKFARTLEIQRDEARAQTKVEFDIASGYHKKWIKAEQERDALQAKLTKLEGIADDSLHDFDDGYNCRFCQQKTYGTGKDLKCGHHDWCVHLRYTQYLADK